MTKTKEKKTERALPDWDHSAFPGAVSLNNLSFSRVYLSIQEDIKGAETDFTISEERAISSTRRLYSKG